MSLSVIAGKLRLASIGATFVLAACAGGGGTSPTQAEPDQLAWYQVETRESQEMDDVLAEITLRVGYVDGTTTATFPLPFELRQQLPPIGIGFITGPANGAVIFSLDDGNRSEVQLVEVASGETSVIFESEEPIIAGAIHPSGSPLFVVRADRQADPMRAGARMVELAIADGAVAGEPTERPWLGEAPMDRIEMFSLFHFTPDGSRLIVQRCRNNACSYRVVTLSDGSVVELDQPGAGEIVGISDEALMVHPDNWGMSKNFQLVPLPGSDLQPAIHNGQVATLVTTEAGAVIVLDKGQPGSPDYVVVEPRTGQERPLRTSGEVFGTLVPEPERQGLRPPRGWAVFAAEGRIATAGFPMGPTLVDLATGRTVQLHDLK